MRAAVAGLLLAIVLPEVARAEDLTVRQRVTRTGPRADTYETTEYVTATRRITDDPGHRTIVDLDAKTLTVLDKAKNTYSVTTFDELRQRMERARQRLDALPPEARKMMGAMDAEVVIRPTGKTEEIAGHEAREYTLQGGPTTGSVWATEEIAMPAKAEDWEKFRGAIGPSGPASKLGEAMAKLKGFPLRTSVTYVMGPITTGYATEVLSVVEQSPPPDVAAMPPGARKVAPGAPGE